MNCYLRLNTPRLRINFPFRWFRFSLRTRATAALTWAKGEHAGVEPEQSWVEPELSWPRPESTCPPWCGIHFDLLCAPATVSLPDFARKSVSAPLQGSCRSRFWIPLVKEYFSLTNQNTVGCFDLCGMASVWHVHRHVKSSPMPVSVHNLRQWVSALQSSPYTHSDPPSWCFVSSFALRKKFVLIFEIDGWKAPRQLSFLAREDWIFFQWNFNLWTSETPDFGLQNKNTHI
jgi:hypothetical protein